MKKKIALILVLCAMATMLCSCSSTSYNEANINPDSYFGNGYFTVIKEWGNIIEFTERIVYANDTGVIYYIFSNNYQGGITPLYNIDGTLQFYKGE